MPNHQQPIERPNSPPRRQRACAPCTKAKARCHFEADNVDDGCDRCRRMHITCAPQTTRSLRRPRQVKPTNSAASAEPSHDDQPPMRTASYGHVVLGAGPYGLRGNPSVTESTASSPAPSVSIESPPHNLTVTITPKDGSRASLVQNNHPSHPQQPLPALPVKTPSQPGFGLSWDQADQAVFDFRIKFTPFFPFVALDPDVSAQELLSKKPLLFRAIMLAAAPLTLAKQREMKRSMQAYIGQHLLVMEERDLGMLQGLLVFIAWGMHDFYFDQKGTYLTYLAMGYAHNLAITRPPPTMSQKMMVAIHPKDIKEALVGHQLTTVLEESHSAEEQRAFLGCQYLLSINASQFGRDSVLKGAYIDHCLNSLVRPTDPGADFLLDKMIRFQKIVEQITEKLSVSYVYDVVERTNTFTVSMSNEMQGIRNQLGQLFANMAREHRHFVLFWAMHSHVLVRLYLPASNLSAPSDKVAAQQQLQCMLYCLEAARSFFATILTLSTENFLFRPFISFSEMLFVLVAASRLLLVEIEGWDLDKARRMLDLPSTLDSLISAFKNVIVLRNQRAAEAAASLGATLIPDNLGDEKGDRFYHWAGKLEWIKNWFEAQVSQRSGIIPGEPQTTDAPNYWAPENQTWNPFMFGYLGDDNWNIEF
ncbi:hypothetical protein F4677DRAFT_431152 [Hypoxylon crocopeplum]|nr:hypothetical protein F4677DRAFT_431152 [Hypoxylon crocopeplum]